MSYIINHQQKEGCKLCDQSLELSVINHIRKDASMVSDWSLKLLVIDHLRRTFLDPYFHVSTIGDLHASNSMWIFKYYCL